MMNQLPELWLSGWFLEDALPPFCAIKACVYTKYHITLITDKYISMNYIYWKKMKHNQKPHSVENKRRCGLVLDINYYARSSLSILLISRDRINIPITVVSNDSNCMPYFRLLYNQFTAKLAANTCYNWNWINWMFKMGTWGKRWVHYGLHLVYFVSSIH